MSSIASNTLAERVHYNGLRNNKSLTEATQKISSGSRINHASDDAGGLFVAQRIKAHVLGLERAIQNTNDGISLLRTAQGAMQEIRNMTLRVKELAVQMANGIYDSTDRSHAQAEVDQLLSEIDSVANNSNFNSVKLLDGTFQNVGIHSGYGSKDRTNLWLNNATTTGLGITAVSVNSQADAKTTMATVETALAKLSNDLSQVGAFENRLKHSIAVQTLVNKESQVAFGRIMDADIALEATNLSRAQVLAQANAAMLAQANNSLSTILSIFN
jgi:flagellin